MDELLKNEAFFNGILFGFNLYQTVIITACKNKESLIIGEDLYYIQSGRERLQEAINKICQ